MRIDIKVGGSNQPHVHADASKHTKFLSSEMILAYLLGKSEKVETAILCKPANLNLTTSDHNIYEAMGSTKPYDNVQLNKLTKLFEVVDVVSYKERKNQQKPILKEERVEEIRKRALTIGDTENQ